jgi:uncharacterized protein with NRDE domain
MNTIEELKEEAKFNHFSNDKGEPYLMYFGEVEKLIDSAVEIGKTEEQNRIIEVIRTNILRLEDKLNRQFHYTEQQIDDFELVRNEYYALKDKLLSTPAPEKESIFLPGHPEADSKGFVSIGNPNLTAPENKRAKNEAAFDKMMNEPLSEKEHKLISDTLDEINAKEKEAETVPEYCEWVKDKTFLQTGRVFPECCNHRHGTIASVKNYKACPYCNKPIEIKGE